MCRFQGEDKLACFCGAPKCSGWLNFTMPEEFDEPGVAPRAQLQRVPSAEVHEALQQQADLQLQLRCESSGEVSLR